VTTASVDPDDKLLAALDDGVRVGDERAVVACDAEEFSYGVSLYNASERTLTVTVNAVAEGGPEPDGPDDVVLRLRLHPALVLVEQSRQQIELGPGEGGRNAITVDVAVDQVPTEPRVLISRLFEESSAEGVDLDGDLRETTRLGCPSEDE
jgi:hypothetical protein